MKFQSELTLEAFQSLRKEVCTRQDEAAEHLGVSPTTLNRWEMGRVPIPRWAEDLLRAWRTIGVPYRD